MDSVGEGHGAALIVAATARLAAEGPNELPRAKLRSPLRIVLDVLREPMLAGGVVYLLLGSREEALILLAFACLSVGITVVQEARTERVLEALRDLTSPRALVIRDGQRQRIAGRDVARGDVIVLAEGDRVPADAVLVTAQDLLADESLLTGEAVPVRKCPGKAAEARPGGEDQPMVFSGSLIVRGTGMAAVTATGPASEIGKIGKSLGQLETETPHLQRQMRKLVVLFAAVGAAVSVAVLVLGVTATFFAVAPSYGLSIDQVRGMTFAALIFGIVALILVDRSRFASILTAITRPNRALAVVLPIVGALLAVTLFWQPARDLFGFAALDPVQLAMPPLAGLAVLVALEVIKPVWRWAVLRKKTVAEAVAGGKAALR